MLTLLLVAGALLQGSQGNAQASQPSPAQTVPRPTADRVAPALSKDADADPTALVKVRRIYVESFGDDLISKEMQSMMVSALVETKRFKVTENRERADAILKGVALEKTSQELHAYGESTAVGGASGHQHGENGGFIARHMGTGDSSVNTETIDDTRVAVRLVNPDGDVIWTTTQESKGAKYKGASADVADKCVKQLLRDVAKLEGGAAWPPPAVPAPAAPDAQHHK